MSDNVRNGSKNGKSCESCGSNDFETEKGYKICTDCGHVNNKSIQLADDPMQVLMVSNSGHMFANQKVHNTIRNELLANQRTTSVQQMGIETAETLALNYCFNSEMKSYLMHIYRKALEDKNFFRSSLKNKRILAAVCAYVTLMNHNESIAIQYICSSVDCNGFDFGQMYSLFVNTFPESKPEAKPIEELVPSILADFRINEEDINQLKGRVIDIISIEKNCWLIDGRSPLHLITAATYLAWKSLAPKERAAIDFKDFSEMFGIQYKKTTIHRIKELNNVLIKLAQLIPWVKFRRMRVHRNNVAFFVDDIIQYPNSLIFDLRADVYRKIKNKENYCEEEDTLWINTFKKNKIGTKRSATSETKKVSHKKMKEDSDISDSEINLYIRNENEIKMIKKLRKRAKILDKESG